MDSASVGEQSKLIFPHFLAHDALQTETLVRLFAPWYRRRVKLYALIPSRPWPRRTAAFLEVMEEELEKMEWPTL